MRKQNRAKQPPKIKKITQKNSAVINCSFCVQKPKYCAISEIFCPTVRSHLLETLVSACATAISFYITFVFLLWPILNSSLIIYLLVEPLLFSTLLLFTLLQPLLFYKLLLFILVVWRRTRSYWHRALP